MLPSPTTSPQTDPKLHLWTRAEYHRIGEMGLLADRRVQLIRGQVIEMSPMKSRHATGIILMAEVFREILGLQGGSIRQQLPLVLNSHSEPEPDLAVVSGSPRDYAQAHPTTALLVGEVSDSTLKFDQQTKSALYAEAGIPEYWILNLVDNQVEVYRDPSPEGYQTRQVWGSQDLISSLINPDRRVSVSELLP